LELHSCYLLAFTMLRLSEHSIYFISSLPSVVFVIEFTYILYFFVVFIFILIWCFLPRTYLFHLCLHYKLLFCEFPFLYSERWSFYFPLKHFRCDSFPFIIIYISLFSFPIFQPFYALKFQLLLLQLCILRISHSLYTAANQISL
jgi:hypothetical protein